MSIYKVRLVGTALSVVAIVSFLTVIGSNASAAGRGRKLANVFFANPLPDYPAFATANKCFYSETKKLGIRGVSQGPTGLAVNDQFVIDRIQQAIADRFQAIIMVPLTPPEFNPLIKQAKAHGMLVATINTGDSTTIQNVELGTSYVHQGETIVANLAKRKGSQNVLVLGNQAGGPQGLFLYGIEQGIKTHHNVHYIAQVFDNGDPTTTPDVVAAALAAHPTANIVASWEGAAVQGIVTAIKQANDTGKVFGVVNDLTPESIAGLKGGQIAGISKQNFCSMASGAVQALAALKAGRKVPKYIDTGITFVTLRNLKAAEK